MNGDDTIYYISDTTGSLSYTLAETDKDGNVIATYNRADVLISQVREDVTSYYLFDGHGDVRALNNEEGRITDKYRYNAYGELIERSGETENHYLYTGEYYDGTSNLYYLRARYMNPSTGTFISMDTYEGSIYDPDTLHKYLYANGNPVKYSDPTGNMAQVIAEARHNAMCLKIFQDLCSPINTILIFVAEYVIAVAIVDYFTDCKQQILIMEMEDYVNQILIDPFDENNSGIKIDYKTEQTLLILSSKVRVERPDTGLVDLSDEEVSALARDKSLSGQERQRYKKEEKIRKLRNVQKRKNK